jgi:hypothetical protein
MPSATYLLFRDALLCAQTIACTYDGNVRELCPVVLGHSKGEEKVLAFQTGGTSSRGLPAGGEWKCIFLAKVRNAEISAGVWREGTRHSQPQTCVQDVDLDINIHVRRRR